MMACSTLLIFLVPFTPDLEERLHHVKGAFFQEIPCFLV